MPICTLKLLTFHHSGTVYLFALASGYDNVCFMRWNNSVTPPYKENGNDDQYDNNN
jgi:hypothetical protein